jgi:AraC-like DNA-binding protein
MPESVIQRFTDPYEHQRAIRNGTVTILVTAPGDYRAELTRINLHRLWMQRSRESLPRVAHSVVAKERSAIFFLTDTDQPSMVHTGTEVGPEHVMFYSSGAVHHHRAGSACRWGALSLTPDGLAAAGRAIAGYDVEAPAVTQRLRPPTHLMTRLRKLHEAAGHLAATAPDVLARPEVASAMEQELVHAIILCLTEGAATADAISHRRVAIMRRFEQALEASPAQPRYVAEVCAAIGVPERTLRLHCLEHLGMSPRRYLWLRRMHQTRRALALADPATMTVTHVATDHGFWELGRFSVAYRKLFGEAPSATLHRQPDQRTPLPILP